MLNLLPTTDKLQVVTLGTTTIDVHTSFADLDDSGATRTVTPGSTNTAITTGSPTTTDVVAAPGTSIIRNVRLVSVRNKHASAATVVTVQHFKTSPTAELIKVTLAAGEELVYADGSGTGGHWTVYDSTGAVKTVVADATELRLAGPSAPAKSEAGTTLYDPAAGKLAHINNAIVTNTHASLDGWLTLSIGSIATKANRFVSGMKVPAGQTVVIPLDLVLDGDTADDLRARQTVDMTYSAMTLASATALIADTNAGSASLMATASWAAKNGAVYYMAVGWTGSPTITSFTDTHTGITWTLVQTISSTLVDLPNLSIYRAQSSGTTNTTTTVNFSAAPTGVFISIIEIVGGDTSGTHGSACIMAAGTRYLSPTNLNLFIAAAEFCGGRIASFSHDGAAGSWTPGSGFTEVHDGTYGTPSTALETSYALSPGRDAAAVASLTSAENLMAIVDVQDSTVVLTVTLNGVEKVK